MQMIYLITLFIFLLTGFGFAIKNSQRHFLFLFCLLIYFVYIFLGPLNAFNLDFYYKLGANYRKYFEEGLTIYLFAIFSFISVYIISYRYIKKQKRKKNCVFIFKTNKSIGYLFFFFICVLYMITRKIEFQDTGTSFTGGFYNYFLFFSDSLILAFSIFLYENKMKKWMWVLFGIVVLFYLILGFRYRILLILIAIIYHFYMTSRLSMRDMLKGIILASSVFFIINFISLNRDAFRTLQFDQVQFTSDTPFDMAPYQYFMHQTDNYSTDFCVLKYFKEDDCVNHDYGNSMFYHIIIRIIPAGLFDGSKKPFIPQQEIIKNCFGTVEGYYSGSAVTNIFEYYIAFGIFGVIFFMGFLGYMIACFSKRLDLSIPRNRVIIVMLAMIFFQEITRGYFPQNVTLTAFLLITLLLFYKKRKNVSYPYQYSHSL